MFEILAARRAGHESFYTTVVLIIVILVVVLAYQSGFFRKGLAAYRTPWARWVTAVAYLAIVADLMANLVVLAGFCNDSDVRRILALIVTGALALTILLIGIFRRSPDPAIPATPPPPV